MKKLFIILMSAMLVISSIMCGCGGLELEKENEKIDTSRTQLNIAVSSDGIGQEYYQYLKAEYEKRNSNIQVMIKDENATITNQKERATEMLSADIAIMSFSDYDNYERNLMDVTDIFTSKSYDENYKYVGKGKGTVSVRDRLDADEIMYFNCGSAGQEKFKVFPFYSSMFGIWYDVDLFEEFDLYDAEVVGYKGLDGISGTADDAYGPDGEEGTFDDGLPATFEDFKKLCLYMKEENIATKPFVWSATEDWMQHYALDYINASYEGKNDYSLFYTLDGTHSKLGQITPETGWKLFQVVGDDMPYRQGEKSGVYFSEFIDQNELYSASSLLGTQSHTAAQTDFLSSATKSDRSAFLLDGSWWQYEARATFNEMASMNEKYALGTRKFSILPIPRFIGTEGIIDQTNTKNIAPCSIGHQFVPLASAEKDGKREIVEDFLLFAMDNEIISKFVEINSMTPTCDIKASDEQMSKWNYMARSMVEYVQDKNTDTLYMRNASATVQGKVAYPHINQSYFTYYPYGAKVNGRKQIVLEEMCLKDDGSYTASVWWQGMCDYSKETFSEANWFKK